MERRFYITLKDETIPRNIVDIFRPSILSAFACRGILHTHCFPRLVTSGNEKTPKRLKGNRVKASKKIVFFVPSFSSIEATAPLGILAISTPLLNAGYEVKIIDSTITPNFKKRVLEELQDALCLGISVVTGPMIRDTVDLAEAVKKWDPDFPVILGGWHPSLLPGQTLEAPYVDIIVRAKARTACLKWSDIFRTAATWTMCWELDLSAMANFT